MTPTENASKAITKVVQKQIFDLDLFNERTLTKTFTVEPVANYQEFLARLGNDTGKVIELLNVALVSQARDEAKNSETGWNQFKLDESGEESDVIEGPFSGTPADPKTVNQLVLTLAKTVFGYSKDAGPEKKRAAKEKASAMIKGNAEIREGLKANMAAAGTATE